MGLGVEILEEFKNEIAIIVFCDDFGRGGLGYRRHKCLELR